MCQRPHLVLLRGLACGLLVLGVGCETVTRQDDITSNPLPESKAHSYLDSQLERFEELTSEYPKDPANHYEIAAIHYQQANYRDSAVALRRAIALDEANPKYFYHLGRLYLAMNETGKAEAEFRRSLELTREERFSGPRAALAYALAVQRKIPEAIEHFERCRQVEPNNLEFSYFLAALHDMSRHDEEAIRFFRDYVERGGKKYRRKALFYLEKLGVELELPEDEEFEMIVGDTSRTPRESVLPIGIESVPYVEDFDAPLPSIDPIEDDESLESE